MNKEKFCPHFHFLKFPHLNSPEFNNLSEWKFCPICGMKRQLESKKLAQILFEAWQEVYPSSYRWDKANEKVVKGCQVQAKAVVELMQEIYKQSESFGEFMEELEEML